MGRQERNPQEGKRLRNTGLNYPVGARESSVFWFGLVFEPHQAINAPGLELLLVELMDHNGRYQDQTWVGQQLRGR